MKKNFTNDIENIDIDVKLPEPVVTVEERRVKLRKRLSRINVTLFAFLLAGTSGFLLLGKRPVMSDTENRKLAPFPVFSKETLLSGEFSNGLSEFFNDTTPKRTKLKNLAASIKDHAGIEMGGVKVYTVNNGSAAANKFNSPAGTNARVTAPPVTAPVITEAPPAVTGDEAAVTEVTAEAVTEPVTEAVTEAPPPPPDDNAGELSNDIMIYKNRGIMIFYGSDECCDDYASVINEYKSRLGDGVNVFNMVCPTAMTFYWPDKSDISHGDENASMEYIKSQLNNITDINTINTLREHKDEPIYSRTDHHWQALGAYYAAKQFAETAGVPFADISTYEKNVIPDYVGTLYGYSGAAALNDNPEDFVYYVPEKNYTVRYYSTSFEYSYEGSLFQEAYGVSAYCTYMGGDEQIVHLETQAPNERTLFIIKDSYGNALVPFLTGSFKNIFVVDMRYFDMNIINFMQEHGATDLLFAMNTFSAAGGSGSYNLSVLLNQ